MEGALIAALTSSGGTLREGGVLNIRLYEVSYMTGRSDPNLNLFSEQPALYVSFLASNGASANALVTTACNPRVWLPEQAKLSR